MGEMFGMAGGEAAGGLAGSSAGMASTMTPMAMGAAQSMMGNMLDQSASAMPLASMAANSGAQAASMNPGAISSAIPLVQSPFGQMGSALDMQMAEGPPQAFVTPNQAGQNASALQQLQQLGQTSSSWAPTANVLQNIIKKQQQPVHVSGGSANTHPGSAIPVNVANPNNPATSQAMSSPLARYAMMLKGIQ